MDGEPRRVGVEIEFAGLTAVDSARIVAELLDGSCATIDRHRYEVQSEELGEFIVELDSRYAHPEGLLAKNRSEAPDWVVRLSEIVSGTLGDVGAIVMPCEIVTPPVRIDQLTLLDTLIDRLKMSGAQGTGQSLFYAFGLHLNPEIASSEPEWITAVLRAETMLSPWLRSVMQIDTTRYLTGFAAPYPPAYAQLLLQPDYQPDLSSLIDDYLTYNSTRDRELDMLPLFAFLDRDRLNAALPQEKINPRPTFHYRLPNAALERPAWSVVLEWNRWCLIERIAAEPKHLAELASAFRVRALSEDQSAWLAFLSEWLVHNFHNYSVSPRDV